MSWLPFCKLFHLNIIPFLVLIVYLSVSKVERFQLLPTFFSKVTSLPKSKKCFVKNVGNQNQSFGSLKSKVTLFASRIQISRPIVLQGLNPCPDCLTWAFGYSDFSVFSFLRLKVQYRVPFVFFFLIVFLLKKNRDLSLKIFKKVKQLHTALKTGKNFE